MNDTRDPMSTMDVMSPKRRKKASKIKLSDLRKLSITINPEEIASMVDTTSMTTMHSMFDVLVSDNLFLQFQTTFQTLGTMQQVFEVISGFIEICSSTIEQISSRRGLTDQQGNDITWLINERNSWRLLYALYQDRATCQDDDVDEMSMFTTIPSEKEIADNFYANNSFVREIQIVIDWLEKNARDQWELLDYDDVAYYTDKTVAWENTLHQLQTTNIAYKSSRQIVSSLDPDAPLRENRPLHDLDADDDKRLLKQVFCEIRRGQLDEAKKRCIHCGQAWRAATLEGWRLFHDSNFRMNGEEKLPIEGNPNRAIWKICAWKMCEDPRVPPEEKAIMGTLCGHLDSVLPQCSTWEDKLWAYARATVDVAVEKEIRNYTISDYIDMPPKYWSYLRAMDVIMNDVSNSEEGQRPERVIQQNIILGTPSELLLKCSQWVEEQCQPQFLRFLTHLVLTLRLLGYSAPEHLGDSVIKAYIKVLMPEANIDSIAYYSSLLPEEDQIEQYAQFLSTITDYNERRESLLAAEKYEMNVSAITEKVVQSIRMHKEDVEMDESFVQAETEEDVKKIMALEWMTFYPQQRAEALWECNALIREFIGQNKISAARKAFSKIPIDSPSIIMEQYRVGVDETGEVARQNLPPKVDAALKEYLCYRAYLDAHDGFTLWSEEFHSSRPTPPTKLSKQNFAESVHFEHKMKRYSEESIIWNQRMTHETKKVKALLHNVLMFPDGGWLDDKYTNDEPRKTHLESLRKLCIPQIFMLLYKVLDSMNLRDEIMEIPLLLMDETHEHYKTFSKQHLKEFTQTIGKTAVKMIENEKEPFGDDEDFDDVSAVPTLAKGKPCQEKAKRGLYFLNDYIEKAKAGLEGENQG